MMPRPLLIGLFALAGVPLAVGTMVPSVSVLGVCGSLLIFVVALLDLLVTPSLRAIDVNREVSEVLSVGARNAVKVSLKNRNANALTVDVHDELPRPSSSLGLPFSVELPPHRNRTCVYHVLPQNRGKNRFGAISLRAKSRLSLWTILDDRRLDYPVRVYPDVRAVRGVELLARQNRVAEAGVRLSRLRGRGTEFDRLREYRRGDEYRAIDWKATARHQSLISREYVVERNQNILFVLDCGRSMCSERDGITHFDRALNAAILLSFIALRQGDSVGLLMCSSRVERWIPPVRGAGAIEKLISRTYDLEPTYAASDYGLMVEELKRRYRKRSLVVHLTHAIDEVHLETIGRHMCRMRSPHLVLVAFLRNVPLYERLNSVPSTDLDAFKVAAAAEMISTQMLRMSRLQKSGLLLIDALPEHLSASLISRYLDIKARHLL